jgi:1-acyl-sn-glycerol-3-phosphate acyltransferase
VTDQPTEPAQEPTPADLAPMRAQVYKDPRPKEYFDRFHHRARTREPDIVYPIVKGSTWLYAKVAFRARWVGADNVPAAGPLILAPNHFSFMDHFFVGVGLKRVVQFMGKSQLFTRPMQWVFTHGGVFPVRRGYRDEDAFITANTILARGGCVVMYAEGGRSRTGKLSENVRPGIGRLALESGAQVVPVAIYGSSHVRNWKRLRFPKVTIEYGEPMNFERVEEPTREQQQATADAIFVQIRTLYDRLVAEGREGALAREKARRGGS